MAQKRPLDSLSNRSRRPATPPAPDDSFFDDLPARAKRASRLKKSRSRAFLWWVLFFASLLGLTALLLPLTGASLIPSATAPTQAESPAPSSIPQPSPLPSPTPEPTPTPTPTPSPAAKNPERVRVLNGTGEAGLAASAAAKLTPLGWPTTTGNARSSSYTASIIYYRDPLLLAAAQVAREALGYETVTIDQSTLAAEGELLIIVGRNR